MRNDDVDIIEPALDDRDRDPDTGMPWSPEPENDGYLGPGAPPATPLWKRLHEAIIEVDDRGCGGTHVMGMGYCQMLTARLQPGDGLAATAERERAERLLRDARRAIEAEILMASDPEGKDQFEKGALAAYHFALAALTGGPSDE